MFQCKNLTLIHKDGYKENKVLLDVNISINKGDNVVLLGPSGSGKSSLIYLLSGLKKPTSGEVIFEGANIGKLSSKDAARIRKSKFGFVFQMHFLVSYLNVIENVLTGSSGFSRDNIEKAYNILDKLGIRHYAEKKIFQLSGGERQRVALARAIVSEPDVIFADEPTASLDHENALEIINLLKDNKENSTVIIATHDTSILNGDERILKINNHCVNEVLYK